MIQGKTYDTLKWIAQILLPALGSLYFALAGIWDLPSAEDVVGTIVVVDTFLGVVLGLSQSSFNKQTATGTVETIEHPDGALTYSLNLDDENPENLRNKKRAVFDVVKGQGGMSSVELIGLLCLIGIAAILIVLL
jgi:hypothetical protein